MLVADVEEIGDDEFLYRKVSVNSGWYDPESGDLKPDAFRPRADDRDGLSFDRARSDLHPEFRTVEEAAVGPSSKGYFVAVLRVGDLRERGIEVVADPRSDHQNPGHALIADIKYDSRKSEDCQNRMVLLAHEIKLRVEGPFLDSSSGC